MIGAAHRHAMWLDNQYVLAAGIFGRTHKRPLSLPRASASSASIRLSGNGRARNRPARRCRGRHPQRHPFRDRKGVPRRGISVVCEKPLTNDSSTAAELVAIAASSDAILAVPHIYSAYAMVRHAARMVRNGDLGRVRFVAAEHASGWASGQIDQWRMDPDIGGPPAPSATSAPTPFICCATSPDSRPPAFRQS